ncbi:MAG TPA: hypothetical protein VE445_10000 [Nitrososphaeraceae archaeon]|nr:hypothetical protein [Nitrososphaeraceae archaeon]
MLFPSKVRSFISYYNVYSSSSSLLISNSLTVNPCSFAEPNIGVSFCIISDTSSSSAGGSVCSSSALSTPSSSNTCSSSSSLCCLHQLFPLLFYQHHELFYQQSQDVNSLDLLLVDSYLTAFYW